MRYGMTNEETAIFEKLAQDFFPENGPILLDRHHRLSQGVFNGWLVLGAYAQCLTRVSFLTHEMAHFVEIDDKRALKDGWGLKLPEVLVLGNFYPEPLTCQATQRELRVMAYEENLLNHYGFSLADCNSGYSSAADMVASTCTFLPDWHRVPGKSQEARGEWIKRRFLAHLKRAKYGFSAFRKEWDRKVALLQKKKRGKKPDLSGENRFIKL